MGAAYLVYLGLASVWRSRRNPAEVEAREHSMPRLDRRDAFRQGLVSNLLNPKIVLIFLTLIPQFVAPGEQAFQTTTLLAATFLGIAILWWRAFSLAVGALGRLLSKSRVRTVFERGAGLVLVGLGIRVATTR